MKPRLVLTIPNAWSVKNFLHSGLLRALQEDFAVEVWTDPAMREGLLALAEAFGLVPVDWRTTPAWTESRSFRLARLAQKSLLYEIRGVKTEEINQRTFRSPRSKTARLASRLLGPVLKGPLAPGLYRWATRVRTRACPSDLIRWADRPTAILTTNPFDHREDIFVRAGVAQGIPVFTMIPSWDNLTSKGALAEGFTALLTWNDVMEQEVRWLYPERTSLKCLAVGNPRTSVLEGPLPPEFSREALWPRLGLDPAKPTLLYANTATRLFPTQPQVIRHLADAPELSHCQVLVRSHPLDTLEAYGELEHRPNVVLWPKGGVLDDTFGFKAVPPPDDQFLLAAMLRHSEVLINAASTISLDAAVTDTPIVSVAYDGDETREYYQSIRSGYDYNHQKPFLASGAGVLVESREAMVKAVAEALAHPELRREARSQLARLATPGDSVHRVVNTLRSLIGAPEKEPVS